MTRPALSVGIAGWLVSLVAVVSYPAEGEETIFTDETTSVGLVFRHDTGATGERLFPEAFGAGVALVDFDNDGDLDVYLVQGGTLRPDRSRPSASPPPIGDRLFRNDIDRGSGLHFVDVTEEAGIRALGYGMGVATGDYDRDGYADLYVTNFGVNQLWHNRGDGTFAEVAAQAGVNAGGWSVAAAFFDYDRDGWPDLYVGSYTDYTVTGNRPCKAPAGYLDYCSPLSYRPAPDRLFRNLGNGTFLDSTAAVGLDASFGNGLGVEVADLDDDGWIDLYVANDEMANQLWLNRGGRRFEEAALPSGCAVGADGEPEASMGIDAADFDDDGDLDLFMTHYEHESNTLYVNSGPGFFEDASLASGLGTPSWAFTGFGTGFLDYDNDGLLDVLVVNGAAVLDPDLFRAGDTNPLRQTNQLFRNAGQVYEETTALAGPAFGLSETSRGAAFGDLDNDGDTDVVISNNAGPARVLVNQVGQHAHWLGVDLRDQYGGRYPAGARVVIAARSTPARTRLAGSAGSYASAGDPRVLVGLASGKADTLTVHWPSGRTERWPAGEPGRYTVLREGEGSKP